MFFGGDNPILESNTVQRATPVVGLRNCFFIVFFLIYFIIVFR